MARLVLLDLRSLAYEVIRMDDISVERPPDIPTIYRRVAAAQTLWRMQADQDLIWFNPDGDQYDILNNSQINIDDTVDRVLRNIRMFAPDA